RDPHHLSESPWGGSLLSSPLSHYFIEHNTGRAAHIQRACCRITSHGYCNEGIALVSEGPAQPIGFISDHDHGPLGKIHLGQADLAMGCCAHHLKSRILALKVSDKSEELFISGNANRGKFEEGAHRSHNNFRGVKIHGMP